MVAKCRRCGANLSPENKFCANCGQSVSPTATQEVGKVLPTTPPSTSPLPPSARLGAVFLFGFIGAIFGMLGGAILLAIASYQGNPLLTYGQGTGLIVFSIVGIVGALRIIERRETLNAGLMFGAGVGILVCWWQLGILSALLFFLGGALVLLKKG